MQINDLIFSTATITPRYPKSRSTDSLSHLASGPRLSGCAALLAPPPSLLKGASTYARTGACVHVCQPNMSAHIRRLGGRRRLFTSSTPERRQSVFVVPMRDKTFLFFVFFLKVFNISKCTTMHRISKHPGATTPTQRLCCQAHPTSQLQQRSCWLIRDTSLSQHNEVIPFIFSRLSSPGQSCITPSSNMRQILFCFFFISLCPLLSHRKVCQLMPSRL